MDPELRTRWREGRIGDVRWNEPRGLLGLGLFGLTALAVLALPLFMLLQSLLLGAWDRQEGSLTRSGLLLGLAINVALLLLLPVVALAVTRPGRRGAVLERLGLTFRPSAIVHLVIGFLAAGASLLVLGAVLLGLERALGLKMEESTLVPQIQSLLDWPLVLTISLVAALTEEVYFRGILQSRVGILLSSALFGIIHIGYGTVLQVVAPFLLGVFFGLLARWTRGLWAPIAAHFAFNFIQLAGLLLERR